MSRYCVIVPTYNNCATVRTVVESCTKYSQCVIVVNDGSTDNTASILSQLEENDKNVIVVSHNENKGKGAALRTGISKASELGYEYAVAIDSDGQHFPEDIPNIAKSIPETGDAAIICGVRNIDTQENMPGKNSFANNFSNFWFHVETFRRLPDTQCGMRAYPVARVMRKKWFSSRYESELEMLVRLVWSGAEPIAVPINVYYPPAEERVSHFRPLRDFSRISVVNTVLTTVAFLYIHPRNFIRNVVAKIFD